MVWLNLSPIPVGRRGIIPRSNDFYLSSLHAEEGGSESAPCGIHPPVGEYLHCVSLLLRDGWWRHCGQDRYSLKRKLYNPKGIFEIFTLF
jgi:hypothetical protein